MKGGTMPPRPHSHSARIRRCRRRVARCPSPPLDGIRHPERVVPWYPPLTFDCFVSRVAFAMSQKQIKK
eukprot:scaffold296479_cov27-Tisochrysis_lutea.AAC.1